MKALFVSYNQAYHEEVLDIMQRSGLKGYTFWDTTMGSGSFKGRAAPWQPCLAYP